MYLKRLTINALNWISKDREHNKRLFEIVRGHEHLKNEKRNNWLWNFKDSLELKNRLRIDLKSEIQTQRLAELIKSGTIALLETRVEAVFWIHFSQNVAIKLSVENMGYQSAIEPIIIVYKSKKAIDLKNASSEQFFSPVGLQRISSIRAGSQSPFRQVEVQMTSDDRLPATIDFVIEILYSAMHGDLISDITELQAVRNTTESFAFTTKYKGKKYCSENAYASIFRTSRNDKIFWVY